MEKNIKPTHVFEYDGVDYVLTEVFGSAVMHNEEEETYCIDKEQIGNMIEHIRQQMGIAEFFQTRAKVLNKKLSDMRLAIIRLEEPVAEEEHDYRDDIDKKTMDRFMEYYRKHKDEIEKETQKEVARAMFPAIHSKRFGETNDCEVIQECIDAYEQRIDELTKQCDELYLGKMDAVKERDKVQAELTDIKNRETYAMDLRLDEIELLNILRTYGECAIFIRKNRGNDAWKAEYLTTKK